jgi:hypothetical protein
MLAGLGCAGLLAAAGSAVLAGPARALVNAPVMEPQVAAADDIPISVAETATAEEPLDGMDARAEADFSGRRRHWRRRHWRRPWRRRHWRRRWRRHWACRWRRRRGRLVRVCRRWW